MASEYLRAAVEHVERLDRHGEADPALTIFIAGLAVECVLRAHCVRRSPQFSARHDLWELARDARFPALFPDDDADDYGHALQQVALIWSSNDRFRPAATVRSRLRRLGLTHGRRGDLLVRVAGEMRGHADLLVRLGSARWNR